MHFLFINQTVIFFKLKQLVKNKKKKNEKKYVYVRI